MAFGVACLLLSLLLLLSVCAAFYINNWTWTELLPYGQKQNKNEVRKNKR